MVRQYTNLTIVGRKKDFPNLTVLEDSSSSHYKKVRFHAFYAHFTCEIRTFAVEHRCYQLNKIVVQIS